jgi:predicted RNA-binding Zn-ribbon protein involved in translation (DUF1610 family)
MIVYIALFIMRGKPKLFAEDDTADAKSGEDAEEGSGLAKVLEAEQRYKRRYEPEHTEDLTTDSSEQDGIGPEEQDDTEVTKKTKPPRKSRKTRSRIGSVPLEKTYSIDRYEIDKTTGKDSKTKGKPKKDSKKMVKGRGKPKDKVTTFLCPSCGSKELYYEAGLISGYKYHCKECDYIGAFVIEKDFDLDTQ